MSNVLDHLKYAESHEWIDPTTPEAAPVGISDHAQDEIQDVVYLELPEVGRVVEKGEAIAVVESVKSANDIYAPVGGEIVEINEPLGEAPELINTDPYGEGWIFKLKIADASELQALDDATAYSAKIG
ncbi:glycine cleavage system protein GcvH [Verrucomicrobiales bacterium]|nr:glycine cleavage system protein GcvH [Verrucomicrobiales bacterium]